MAKIEMLVNLENFNNMKIETNEYADIGECYKEVLSVLEQWEDYSKFAISLGNNVRRILGLEEREIKQTEKKVNGRETREPKTLEKSEVAETKSAGSKYHVDPKYYVVLSEFEIKCLATFQKYETNGWDISDKQQKIWSAIESKIKKAKVG